MNTQQPLIETALAFARIGFPVLACKPNEKRPATSNGFYDATLDLAKIQQTWIRNPNFNIGIRTGTLPNGRCLVVLDEDPRNGGNDTMSKLLATHGPLPDTAKVITGRRDGRCALLFFVSIGREVEGKAWCRS
ncbi:MAG: bifunctional DNA primase/polymerase [Aestuariivirga sp.]